MMKRTLLTIASLALAFTVASAQADELSRLRNRTAAYVDSCQRQPDWLLSRLAMFWTSHATDVFVNGDVFDHLDTNRAPYPTVKLCGTRSHGTNYKWTSVQDLRPYDDDATGSMTLVNKETGLTERVDLVKTGMVANSINRHILSLARDAAKVYTLTSDTAYASMAKGVLDTYLRGILYRNTPQDVTHGHQNTIIGIQTFEVIHEDAIADCADVISSLGQYLTPADHSLYDSALRKWMENIIANGVPHNNWDLYQAELIMKGALVLSPDDAYPDGKGRDYYLNYIVRENSIRQWSMKKLADYGFDSANALWYECPGYSMGVVQTFADFADRMDRESGVDLFREVPVLIEANQAALQYLMPNRMICGYGDTHPWYLSSKGLDAVLRYADRHSDDALRLRFDSLKAAIAPDADKSLVEKYVARTFYAPKSSWLIQRTGMDARHDLAISLNGSLGNHQHANGISMELYGKGWVLGPDAGIGKTLYSGQDYNEYYSRFPAHNTVCVDGVSDYPVMMSQHGFDSVAMAEAEGCTFSQVAFTEPETQSDQLRTNGIVRTSDAGGYYVDVFRSRRKDGRDKFHDYFYHNLGQTMTLTSSNGADLNLRPTNELAFAGGHLYAYSYIHHKTSAQTTSDIRATFTVNQDITMTMWMQGAPNREVFQALSPVNMEYERMKNEPYDIDQQPVLTFIARQQGNAWDHPFVAIFEPSDKAEPSEIESVEFFTPKSKSGQAVGIKVTLKSGHTDLIFSSPTAEKMTYGGVKVNATYAVFRDGQKLIIK